MTPEVAAAIEEVRAAHADATITVRDDGDGGAFVIVEPIELGASFSQDTSWIGFHITFQYPYSDVYPHFIRGDLARPGGEALGEALSSSTFEGRSAIQISRRSNALNPVTDTAAIKLAKVLEWLTHR